MSAQLTMISIKKLIIFVSYIDSSLPSLWHEFIMFLNLQNFENIFQKVIKIDLWTSRVQIGPPIEQAEL